MRNSSARIIYSGLLFGLLSGAAALAGVPDFSVTAPGGPIPDEGIAVFPVVISPKITIASMEVEIQDLSHTFPEDLDLYLISPSGNFIELMTDRGGDDPITNVDLVFRDSETGIPGEPIVEGDYQPEGLFNSTDAGFGKFVGGSSGVGSWLLLAIDSAADDTGSIGSFTLRGTVVPEPGVVALLAVGALAFIRRRRTQS